MASERVWNTPLPLGVACGRCSAEAVVQIRDGETYLSWDASPELDALRSCLREAEAARDRYREALREARAKALEEAAGLVDRWHISKGGYAALAHEIRSLSGAAAGEGTR